MKSIKKITCKKSEECHIMDEDPGFGITQSTLTKYGLSSWSFMQRYRISIGDFVWHGILTELPPDTGNYLIINRWMGYAFGIKKPTKATITRSNASEIQLVQYEEIETKEPTIGAIEGLEFQKGDICRFQEKKVKITACDPAVGYITNDTYWEDINGESEDENGDGEPVVSQLENVKPARSTSGFDKIIGMEDVIREVKQKILLPYKKSKLAKKFMHKPLKGALIYGPNGVGKTALVRAIADEANVPLISLPSGADLESIVKAYQAAANKKDGCIVFIDEIDGLLNTSGFGNQGNPYVTALQECIDGYSQNDGVFTIGTTNFPGSLPQGLKRSGRLDVLINVGLPNREDRRKLFEFFLRGLRVSEDIEYKELARMTDSYTGSDIESVVKEAGIAAMVAHQRNPKAKIVNKRLSNAISGYTSTGARIMRLRKPVVSFDDIYGQDKLIRDITTQLDFISGKKQAKYSNISNEAILLHGPTGTGKTFLAQAIADYLDVSFLYKKGASFKSKWVGETERNIQEMFARARTYKPLLILIDEIDGIGRKRNGADGNRHAEEALTVLLGEMEGVVGNEGIYLVGTTNVPEQLDEAVLSRFRRKIPMPKPDSSQRRAVLEGLFEELPEDLVQFDYDLITSATKGYTQRSLNGLYKEVCIKLDTGQASKVTTTILQSIIEPTENTNINQLDITG